MKGTGIVNIKFYADHIIYRRQFFSLHLIYFNELLESSFYQNDLPKPYDHLILHKYTIWVQKHDFTNSLVKWNCQVILSNFI